MTETLKKANERMTNYRWVICAMLLLATTVNYMDRQVLSLTWKDFIAPEFHWGNVHYGYITATFSIVYAIANFFSGRIIDWLGTRKGYLWAIGVWSAGACLHALCGKATEWVTGYDSMWEMAQATGAAASLVTTVSVWFFLAARIVLAAGESGNFPSAVKATAEYFPQKDRAFATSIFNAGSTIGALVAPLCIPILARYFRNLGWGGGWEMAFVVIGGLGFLWMGLWLLLYQDLSHNSHVNESERAYILQDAPVVVETVPDADSRRFTYTELFRLPQTWGIVLAKLLTDGVWWFLLFWTPAYLSDVYGYTSDSAKARWLMFTMYAITMLSLYGGKLPAIIMNRTGWNAYRSRMRAMLIFALFPLLGLSAQSLGNISCWLTMVVIGIVGAAHQSWSANLYSVGSDLFPKSAVGTITGLNGMAGGIGSFFINLGSGYLLDYVDVAHTSILGIEGKEAGYFLLFAYCSVAYLIGWAVLKLLVPSYKPVQ